MPVRQSSTKKFLVKIGRGTWTCQVCPSCGIPAFPVSQGFCFCGLQLRGQLIGRDEAVLYAEAISVNRASPGEIELSQSIDRTLSEFKWG